MASKRVLFFPLIVVVICFSSCYTYKNVPYLQDIPDTTKPLRIATMTFKNPVIQNDDVLSITIQTLDQNMTSFLNNPQTSGATVSGSPTPSGGTTSPQAINGYLVDKNGEVELPFAGKIKVSGLTTSEARDLIQTEVAKAFINPIVNVRFANYRVTVMGEVARPGTYIVPNEKVNIFDGLGLAGDLTIFGRRENVLLMRDSLNQKTMVRLNLNSKNIIESPYFYLQSGDIIYVEPTKYKIESVDAVRDRNFKILTSALIVLIALASRIKF